LGSMVIINKYRVLSLDMSLIQKALKKGAKFTVSALKYLLN